MKAIIIIKTILNIFGVIFVPLDGMNEKGLWISDLMAGDKERLKKLKQS